MRSEPRLVSVVVAVLDEEEHLGEQLAALAEQTYRGAWEVLVVDNGCTDGSIAVALGFAEQLPGLRIVAAPERRSLAHAKNRGAAEARGDLLAFCDADDVVSPGWLEALVSAARTADVVGGTFELETLNDPLSRAWRPGQAQRELTRYHRYLPAVPGGNSAVWADVARELGWDEWFRCGGEDQDFSWRAQLASYELAFAPGAVVRLRYRTRLRDLARQWYGYGVVAPRLYRSFRPLGMPGPDLREALAAWRWLARRSIRLLPSREGRGNWLRIASLRTGRLVGSIRHRVLFP
jgi:glycosyltransferase involved in cell wall biosynthesis